MDWITERAAAAHNKGAYLKAKDAFNRRDLDACIAHYAADHRIRSREAGNGREHIRQFFASMHDAWGHLRIVVEHVVAEDDWVMGHCRTTAIHDKSVMGVAPTGRCVETTFWDLHRFNKEGLIAETWNLIDMLSIMQQLNLKK